MFNLKLKFNTISKIENFIIIQLIKFFINLLYSNIN